PTHALVIVLEAGDQGRHRADGPGADPAQRLSRAGAHGRGAVREGLRQGHDGERDLYLAVSVRGRLGLVIGPGLARAGKLFPANHHRDRPDQQSHEEKPDHSWRHRTLTLSNQSAKASRREKCLAARLPGQPIFTYLTEPPRGLPAPTVDPIRRM